MHEYETIPEMISDTSSAQEDPYTYYTVHPAMPSVPRYVPNQKKKQPWGLILVIALLCALLGGAAGAGGVLPVQAVCC